MDVQNQLMPLTFLTLWNKAKGLNAVFDLQCLALLSQVSSPTGVLFNLNAHLGKRGVLLMGQHHPIQPFSVNNKYE